MKNSKSQTIAISKLVAHPANPNVMSREKFNKLVRNIERTGLYEPIVVRPHPKMKDCFEIINGHHRVKALVQLGRKEADCVVWDIDDEQTCVLLMTLNRLCGSDEPAKKIELLKMLSQRMPPAELAKMLPASAKQIEQLINLKLSNCPVKLSAKPFAIPLVFFVTADQNKIIEDALGKITIPPGQTKAQRRAAAITEIADNFLRIEKCQTTNV
ncbi:MAG: ParB/RepB/Spo0J family partition protein [Sedimentisphaerales bacterium]|jgi:ParB/RepB/Spo0J family partition protein